MSLLCDQQGICREGSELSEQSFGPGLSFFTRQSQLSINPRFHLLQIRSNHVCG